MVNILVCTDLSGKELHRQVGVDRMMTLWIQGGVMVSTLAINARGVGSNTAPGTIFPSFITSKIMTWFTLSIFVKACVRVSMEALN